MVAMLFAKVLLLLLLVVLLSLLRESEEKGDEGRGEAASMAAAAQMPERGRRMATSVRVREPASGKDLSGKYSRMAKMAVGRIC